MTSLQELIFKSADPLEAVMKMGKALAESRMFGAGNPFQGVIIVTHCLDKEIALLDWAAEYHLVDINGKMLPTMKADAMLARFQRAGGTFVWDKDGSDQAEAVLTLRIDDRQQTVRYTTEDAKRAGLIKADKPASAWNSNRPAMLRARCVSSGLRMFAPGTIAGVYTADELGGETTPVDAGDQQLQPGQVGFLDQAIAGATQQASHAGATATATPTATEPTKRRGRPAGSKNQSSGAADGAGASAVQDGTAADSKTTDTAAAPVADTSPAASAPQNEATTAVDESRFAQVQWLERMKAKFYSMTPEKLKELGVPDDKVGGITLNDAKWATIEKGAGTAVIADMQQEFLDQLETLFKTREERLRPFVEGKDVESFLNSVIAWKA